MLLTINPYTLFYLSSHEIGLAKLSLEMDAPLLPLREGRENELSEEKKRWLCVDVLLMGECDIVDGGVYEENCVHVLSLIVGDTHRLCSILRQYTR